MQMLKQTKEVMMMNRQEFMGTLRRELSKLPPEEIADATEFYEEYFDETLDGLDLEGLTEEEASAEKAKKEAELINEIGSPKAIARQIRAEYASKILEGNDTALAEKPTVGHKLSAVWWVIIGICSAPVSIPVAIGLAALVFGIVVGMFGIIAGLFLAVVEGFIASLVSIGFGISSIPISVPAGVMCIGAGLMGLSLSAAAAVGAVLLIKAIVVALAGYFTKLNEKRKLKKFSKMANGGEM